MIEYKVEQTQIKQLLAKNFPIKVIQSVISTVNTCKQKIIEFGIENKKAINKDKLNYCHSFPILTLLGVNHHLLLLHMSNSFAYINNTEERINKFTISYMVNPTLHLNKSFKEKV